jgi:hypothetical protein
MRSWNRGARRPTLIALAAVFVATAQAAEEPPLPPVAACASAPIACVEARRSTLRLNEGTRRLSWKWSARDVVDIRDLSNPVVGRAGYDLCVYDAAGALAMAAGVPPRTVCDGVPCWRARPWGYEYRDRGAGSFGITKIAIKAAAGRTDRIKLAAEGDLLPLPVTPPASPLTVQLVRTDDPTVCWTAAVTPR